MDWVAWMIATGLLAVGEMATVSFFLGPIALATLVTAAVALAGAGLAVQFAVFALASAASLALVRPIARRHLHTPSRLRTGTAALVGADARVLERVDGDGGQIKLAGEVWTARAFDEADVLEPGARVHVMQIDGATAVVADSDA